MDTNYLDLWFSRLNLNALELVCAVDGDAFEDEETGEFDEKELLRACQNKWSRKGFTEKFALYERYKQLYIKQFDYRVHEAQFNRQQDLLNSPPPVFPEDLMDDNPIEEL